MRKGGQLFNLNRDRDFSRGSMARNILSMAIPMTIAQLVNVLYSVTDRFFIGHIPGASSLGLTGIGIVFPIISIITAFTNLFGMGGAPLCAIARGRKDDKTAERIIGASFYMLALTAEFDPSLTSLTVDGIFGSRTAQAVRTYQRKKGLLADGIVGEQTWHSLYGEFSGIERDLRNDNLNFPQGEAAVPAMASEGAVQPDYGSSSRLGQFPGYPLEPGHRDKPETGGILV